MKAYNRAILAVGLTAAMAVTTASSQPLITVDEFGLGDISGTPLPSAMATDPFSGLTTLTYTLPFPAIPGDVVLTEPSIGTVSDVMRFDGNFHLFFFSDASPGDPADSPADGPLPPPDASLPRVAFLESGSEGGPQGLFYSPAGGLPGDNSAGATYNFISEVPEPGSLALVAAGLGVCGYGLRRRMLSRG